MGLVSLMIASSEPMREKPRQTCNRSSREADRKIERGREMSLRIFCYLLTIFHLSSEGQKSSPNKGKKLFWFRCSGGLLEEEKPLTPLASGPMWMAIWEPYPYDMLRKGLTWWGPLMGVDFEIAT